MSRVSWFALFALCATLGAAARPQVHLLPRPAMIASIGCRHAVGLQQSLIFPKQIDAAGFDLLRRRWVALGLPQPQLGATSRVHIRHAKMADQAYALRIDDSGITITSGDSLGTFYALTTLAQLATHARGTWVLPCVSIHDAPSLRWRILSDDVSRGPLPTMRYFKERIRTIASFKMNGYSPYMEHVFVSPTDPLPAPYDGITPQQLHDLALYAKRYHVALIPEQQTFGHMHNTLSLERYAGLAEEPHGYLLSPAVPAGNAYVQRLIEQELAAVPHPPFFHIGSDEPITLGTGASKELVARLGRSRVYADHIDAMAKIIAASGARPMVWDDAIEADPSILSMIPKSTVIINWHYGRDATFLPYIHLIAAGGFEQMVSPGANNWSEIFPDIALAMHNERTFINEGKASHVLGLFQTVWHDDGETLYEATWYPVVYAASASWESRDVTPERYAADFPHAFFGIDDPRYSADVLSLGNILTKLEAAKYDWTDYLFWADAFDPQIAARMNAVDLHGIRLSAESIEQHLLTNKPPLHRNAAFVMRLAALRYDTLARKFQIADEVRAMYADAKEQVGKPQSRTIRDLLWSRYWLWELRDRYEAIAPMYKRAWLYESRRSHLASNLERYHMVAAQAIRRADALTHMEYEDFLRDHRFPSLDAIFALPSSSPAP